MLQSAKNLVRRKNKVSDSEPPENEVLNETPKNPSSKESDKKKWWHTKNKPSDSRWKQQELDAWRPILKFKQILFCLLAVAILFIPLGFLMLQAARSVKIHPVPYSIKCPFSINWETTNHHCELKFNLTENYEGDVFFYYELNPFHGNTRRMTTSFSTEQSKGYLDNVEGCDRYSYEYFSNETNEEKCKNMGGVVRSYNETLLTMFVPNDLKFISLLFTPKACFKRYAPCGALANAFFNDTFTLFDEDGEQVPWTYDDLLHWGEKNGIKNPTSPNGEKDLCKIFDEISVKPQNWSKKPCELDPDNPENNGFLNFDFIVWMRQTTRESFRKNYRRLVREKNTKYENGLPAGNYTLVIEDNYPLKPKATHPVNKTFVITTKTWMGNSDSKFLGICYLVVGFICLLLAPIFSFVHWRFGHTLEQIGKIPEH